MTNSFIDDLREDGLAVDNLNVKTNSAPPKAAKIRETFPCESCLGTGKYKGVRIHQTEEKCFACGGKGHFFKSYKDRMASKRKRHVAKAQKLHDDKLAFRKMTGQFLDLVQSELLPWNDFAASIMARYDETGSMSQGQIEALQKQLNKAAARKEAKRIVRVEETKAQQAAPIDTSAIRTLFDVAKSNGLKRPGLWYGDLKISEAPVGGRNPEALYVKRSGEYVGKIIGATFHPGYGVKQLDIITALLEIAANPAEELRAKGKQMGKCCCCGRDLTDPESIANGIGPICATNWGL